MNPDSFTHKTNEALVKAHEMASEAGHAQLTPLHLTAALASDKSGIFRQAIAQASGGDGAAGDSFGRLLRARAQHRPQEAPLAVPAAGLCPCVHVDDQGHPPRAVGAEEAWELPPRRRPAPARPPRGLADLRLTQGGRRLGSARARRAGEALRR
jgi:hypothetical protein